VGRTLLKRAICHENNTFDFRSFYYISNALA
jgi:hypothetical protein